MIASFRVFSLISSGSTLILATPVSIAAFATAAATSGATRSSNGAGIT